MKGGRCCSVADCGSCQRHPHRPQRNVPQTNHSVSTTEICSKEQQQKGGLECWPPFHYAVSGIRLPIASSDHCWYLHCSCATSRDRRKNEEEKRRKQEEEGQQDEVGQQDQQAAVAPAGAAEGAAEGGPLAAAIARRQQEAAAAAAAGATPPAGGSMLAPQVCARHLWSAFFACFLSCHLGDFVAGSIIWVFSTAAVQADNLLPCCR